MPVTTRILYNTIVDENGNPLQGVTVQAYLVIHQFVKGQNIEVIRVGVSAVSNANGYWELPLVPNDTMEDPESFYIIEEGTPSERYHHRHYVRIPSGTEPLPLENARITPPFALPAIPLEALVSGVMVEGQQPLKGQVKIAAGEGISLSQDNYAKKITIAQIARSVWQKIAIALNGTLYGIRSKINFIAGSNINISVSDDETNDAVNVTISAVGGGGGSVQHNLLDGSVHPDTATTGVQRGMLIVGRLVAGIVKWAGLALGAAGKFLKSDGADVIWGDVNWDEVQNKPSTFPPSPHTHVRADITDFAHTHPLSELQQSGATVGQVPKWSGTQWQAGNVDWNEVTNKPSTFPPEPHNHPRADITDFFSAPFWSNIPDRPSTFPPDTHTHDASDITSGRLSTSRLPTSATANRFLVVRNANSDPTYDAIQASDLPSHTHTKSDITDFAHAATHVAGGSDELTGNLNANARVGVAREGTLVGTRRQVNFRQGAGVAIDAEDEAANERVNVTIRSRVDINTQMGTAYTLQLSDAGNLVQMNNSSANTVTIPTNASVPFPIGTRIIVQKYGTGDTTIQADTGVTLRDPNNQATITTQYDLRVLLKIGTDEWVVI